MTKIEISQCISQNIFSTEFVCFYCKGVVVEPFKCDKCHNHYCKVCMEKLLHDDVNNDGTKGCISYSKQSQVRIDDICIESDIKCRSTNFVYAHKDYIRKISRLRFKCTKCVENPLPANSNGKTSSIFAYNMFIRHLNCHVKTKTKKKLQLEDIETPQFTTNTLKVRKRDKKKIMPTQEYIESNFQRQDRALEIDDTNDTTVDLSFEEKRNEDEKFTLYENGSCTLCTKSIRVEEFKTHIMLKCPELEQICYFCKSKIKRSELLSHFKECPESFIECPDCEHLIKRGENIQSHYCRGYDLDIKDMLGQLMSLNRTKDEKENQISEIKTRELNASQTLEETANNFESIKERFLMRFEKKEYEELVRPIEEKWRKLINNQPQNKKAEAPAKSNGILAECNIECRHDRIRYIYSYECQNMSREDEIFVSKNQCSLSIWSINQQKCMITLKICDIVQREKQLFVIDQYVILEDDILIVSMRNKKETKILAFKIPKISDLNDFGLDHLVIMPEEAIGSYEIIGRVSLMKDTLLSKERIYLINEVSRNENVLYCFYVQETLTEYDDISISFVKVIEQKFDSEIHDICEWLEGPEHYLLMLFGRTYEVYNLKINEDNEADQIGFKKMDGAHGILLPPNLTEYYFKIQHLEHNAFAFIGSNKIEVRRLVSEYVDSFKLNDDIVCNSSMPKDFLIDKTYSTKMENKNKLLTLFHDNHNAILKWPYHDNNLVFQNVWKSTSIRKFIDGFYLQDKDLAIILDVNNTITFIKFAHTENNIKQEI